MQLGVRALFSMLGTLDLSVLHCREENKSVDSGDLFKALRKWWRGKPQSERSQAALGLDEPSRRAVFELLIELRARPLYRGQAQEVLTSLAGIEEWTAGGVLGDISQGCGFR